MTSGLRKPIADAAMPALISLLQNASTPPGKGNAALARAILAVAPGLSMPVADAAVPALVSLLQDQANAGGRYNACAT